MNAEIKQEWIAALRSGEYKQGQVRLTRITGGDEFDCCLGVLCKLAQPKLGNHLPVVRIVFPGGAGWKDYNYSTMWLPTIVMAWAELGSDSGRLSLDESRTLEDREGHTVSLAGCNDYYFSFNQIADLIDYFL